LDELHVRADSGPNSVLGRQEVDAAVEAESGAVIDDALEVDLLEGRARKYVDFEQSGDLFADGEVPDRQRVFSRRKGKLEQGHEMGSYGKLGESSREFGVNLLMK
jgi:hypothetical protein